MCTRVTSHSLSLLLIVTLIDNSVNVPCRTTLTLSDIYVIFFRTIFHITDRFHITDKLHLFTTMSEENLCAACCHLERDAHARNVQAKKRLNVKLRDIESMKARHGQKLDKDRELFLKGLCSSKDNLDLDIKTDSWGTIIHSASSESLTSLRGSHKHRDLLRVHDEPFRERSSSESLLSHRRPCCLKDKRDSSLKSSLADANKSTESVSSLTDEPRAGEYSISCSMKVSQSEGTFESKTGKRGLGAWRGKNTLSPKIKAKHLHS